MTKLKLSAGLLVLFFMLGLISCSKKSDNNTSDKNVNEAEMVAVNNEDVTETDEDLLTVDYREFYDKLSPHGEWIEVKGRDIGVDLKKDPATGSSHRTISIGELFGVKEAYADDVDFGAFFVWKPAPGLAVGVTTGEPVEYVPYSNGQWVNTSQGWYFRAASEPEEITHHYGRWVHSPAVGWVWVPGRVWAPAWVDWREQDEYIAWEPVPPSVYIVNNVIVTPPVIEERYVVVEKRYFAEPEVYRYMYKENKNKVMIKEWRRLDGVMVMNKTVINKGPDVTVIQTYTNTTFGVVTINPVTNINDVTYSTTEYRVYQPEFKKVKMKGKVTKVVTAPGTFITYENARVITERQKHNESYKNNESASENNKGKENKNENSGKDFRQNRKYIDDGKMKDGGKTRDNGKKEGERKKDNGNRDNGKNDNGKKENKGNYDKKGKDNSKGNDNGKSNGKEKGNKKFKNDKSNSNGNDRSGYNKNQGKNENGKMKGQDRNDKGKNNNGNNKKGKQ